MKKIFLWSLTLAVCVLSGCSDDYDDTELRNGLSDLKDRVAKLETQLAKLNGDITTMDALVKKLESNVSVVKVESSTDGKSYTIYFSDDTKATITNGKDGSAGADAPVIGVKEEGGVYYWAKTVDGKTDFLTDGNGQKLRVTAEVTPPRLSVDEEGYWEVSYDGGTTWERITDAAGDPVKAITDDGSSIQDSFFSAVTQDDDNVYFTLRDGSVITVAKRTDFYLILKLVPETVIFTNGQNRTFEAESVGVADVVISKPAGWRVVYDGAAVSITAPAADATGYEAEGTVSMIYFDGNDRSSVVKFNVEIGQDFTGTTDGDQFTVEITELTGSSIKATITGKDAGMSFYVYPYEEGRTDEQCITQLKKRYKVDLEDDPSGSYVDYLYKGVKNYRYSNLSDGIDYELVVMGVTYDFSAKTIEAATPLMRIPFRTPAAEVVNTTYMMSLSNITWYGATCMVHPSDGLPYFYTFVKKSQFDQAFDEAEFAQDFIDRNYLYPYYDELEYDYSLEWSQFTATGDRELVSPGFLQRDPLYISEDVYPLEPLTDYYAIAFGCNDMGEFSSAHVSRKAFRTPAFVPAEKCTFSIDAQVEAQNLDITVIPSDPKCTYITFIDERDNFSDHFNSKLQYAPYDLYWRLQALAGEGKTLAQSKEFYTGTAKYSVVNLKASTAYIVFAYGCTADGVITTEPEIIEVVTRGTIDNPNEPASAKRKPLHRNAYRVIR